MIRRNWMMMRIGPDWGFRPLSEKDIADQDPLMLRRQRLFRWAAESIARAMSEVAEVKKVAALAPSRSRLGGSSRGSGSIANAGLRCSTNAPILTSPVWMTGFENLKNLKRAMNRGLSSVQNTPYGGVANHQVDVHLFEARSGVYRGRLCYFGECPKPGKRECFVPQCGAQPFLR